MLACLFLVACGGPPAPSQPPLQNIDLQATSYPPATNSETRPTPRVSADIHYAFISINSDDHLDAIDAIDGLSQLDAMAMLERLLWDDHRDVREAALERMLELGTLEQDGLEVNGKRLTDLLTLLITDPNNEFRQTVVDALTDIGGPLAVPLLHSASYDPDPAVRQAALEGLEKFGKL